MIHHILIRFVTVVRATLEIDGRYMYVANSGDIQVVGNKKPMGQE